MAELAGFALLAVTTAPARAQTIIVGNDEKVILDDSGRFLSLDKKRLQLTLAQFKDATSPRQADAGMMSSRSLQ